FQIKASDIEGDTLTFHHFGGVFDLNVTTGVLNWMPGQEDVGTRDLIVEIRDSGGGMTPVILRATVIEVNDPPVAGPISDAIAVAGVPSRFLLDVEDEEGAALDYGSSSSIVTVDANGWVHINASSSYIGDHQIRISISDGLNTIYVGFNLTVTEGAGGDDDDDSGLFQYILGGLGVGLAIVAILFLGLLFLRRNDTEEWVQEELEQADEMYEEDMESAEGEYEPMDNWTEE
ncbi:MAG: hypothetical protein ACMUHB_03075, partial [Thermoplasmatota archaeon]